jgi:hypothetical protein
MPPHVPYGLRGLPEVKPTYEVGTHMRHSYDVSMRWMVICENEVPRGAY